MVYPNSGESGTPRRRWTGRSRFPAAEAARWEWVGARGWAGAAGWARREIAAVARVLQGAAGGAAGANCPHDQPS